MFYFEMLQICKLVKSIYKDDIKKHHSFILCKQEKKRAQRCDRLLHGFRGIYFLTPYGIKPGSRYQGFSRPTEEALDIIRALVHLMDLVQLSGVSFNGKLTLKDLYWLSETKTVKISSLAIGDMVKMTGTGIQADFTWIHNIIRDNVFAGMKVPRELKHLMRYMVSDPVKYGNLIRHNICLLDDESKVGKFIILYQKHTILRQLDHSLFLKALSYVKCGVCDSSRDWQADVKLNTVLKRIFKHQRQGYYLPDESGVALFGRNCCHHCTDDCVVCKNNLLVIEYSNADVFPMVECHIPGLFAQVQEGLFEVIEIQYSHKLQRLRNKITGGG